MKNTMGEKTGEFTRYKMGGIDKRDKFFNRTKHQKEKVRSKGQMEEGGKNLVKG